MEEAEPYDIATVLPFLTYSGSNVMWFRRTYDPPHWAPSMHFHAYPMPISVIHHLLWDHASFTDCLGPKQLAASSMPHQHLSPNMQIAELPSFLPNLPLDPRMLRTSAAGSALPARALFCCRDPRKPQCVSARTPFLWLLWGNFPAPYATLSTGPLRAQHPHTLTDA